MIVDRDLRGFFDDGVSVFPREQKVRFTSVLAFEKLTREGVRETQAQRVFKLLLHYAEGLTIEELSKLSKLRVNAVCGRLADLRKIELFGGGNLVVDSGVRLNVVTRVNNLVWVINPEYFNLSR
jgi:hypothetical protein